MKWLRRSLAFLMVDFLVLLLMLALAVWQLNSTVLRSSYYSELLDQADIYSFLLTEVPTTAIGELDSSESGEGALGDRPLQTLGIAPEDLVSSLNAALPVPWVQGVAEHGIDQLGGYVTGERDEFVITIQFDDRVEALSTEFKSLISQSNTYDLIFDEFVAPAVGDTVLRGMPVELDLTEEQVMASVGRIAPRDWVEPQFLMAVDEVTPYLAGRADSFEVVVALDGRVEIALHEVKGLLRESGAYDSLYDQLIDPLVYQSLGGSIQLPYGITLDDQEIATALRDVAPPAWIQEQAEKMIDDATPYLTGRVDNFSTNVSLGSVKTQAVLVLEDSVARELGEVVDSLPDCQGISLQQILAVGLNGTIECLPQDATVREFTNILSDQIASVVSASIVAGVPDDIVFSQQDLYDTLSLAGVENGSSVVDSVRARVRDGWVYTDEDFVVNLGELAYQEVDGQKASEKVDQVRTLISEGWTIDEIDFLAFVNSDFPVVTKYLERARRYLKLARNLGFLLFLPVILMIIGIAFVGGKGWSGRFTWAFGSLIASSLVILFMYGVVYGLVFGSILNGLQQQILEGIDASQSFSATRALVATKVVELIETVYNDFSSGMINRSLVILAVSIFGLITTLSWDSIVQVYDRYPASRVLDRIRRR